MQYALKLLAVLHKYNEIIILHLVFSTSVELMGLCFFFLISFIYIYSLTYVSFFINKKEEERQKRKSKVNPHLSFTYFFVFLDPTKNN